jgi:VWFA-related protein
MFRISCLFLLFSLVVSAEDYEVTVTSVNVWVRVTDKSGKPVTGLQQSDFQVFEDDQPVTPTCFEQANFSMDTATGSLNFPQSQPADPIDPNRKQIVFVMDLWNTSQTEFLYLKARASEFMNQLSKNWNITLVSLIPGAIHIDVDNSQDPDAIQKSLDRMTANPLRDLDTINNRRDLTTATRNAEGMMLRESDVVRLINELCGRARDLSIQEKLRSKEWLGSLKRIDDYVKKQDPGTHKVVLFFSGGISSNPGKQYFDIVRDSRFVRDYIVDDWKMREEFPACDDEGGLELQKELKKLVGQLNRYNITFYTVSSRGPINDLLETVRESNRKFNVHDLDFLKDYQDYLSQVADETGGIYFGSSLNFKRGFDLILADLSHQYLICYKPPQHSKQGAHSIKVKSKRNGIELRHRDGYYD